MGFSYSQDGYAYRLARATDDIRDGEIYFETVTTPEQLAAAFPGYAERASAMTRGDALSALVASDRVILRCVENGLSIPDAWASYRRALRNIASGTLAPAPIQPPYPEGT